MAKKAGFQVFAGQRWRVEAWRSAFRWGFRLVLGPVEIGYGVENLCKCFSKYGHREFTSTPCQADAIAFIPRLRKLDISAEMLNGVIRAYSGDMADRLVCCVQLSQIGDLFVYPGGGVHRDGGYGPPQ